MAIRFNAEEIFLMAEQIERNGTKFYRKVAETAPNPASRQMLLDLAAMEVEHERTFAALRTKLNQQARQTMTFDPDSEGEAYLRAFADGEVFDVKADPAAKLTGRESMNEILRTAIGMEKDSVLFYVGIRDMVPANMGKNKVELIIKQEMGHIALLSGRLASLK